MRSRSTLTLTLVLLAAPALAQAQAPSTQAEREGALPPTPPGVVGEPILPSEPGETLSDQLGETDGVIDPNQIPPDTPDNVLPPPDGGTAVTPVIPPPDMGGDPGNG